MKILKPEYQELSDGFYFQYGESGCRCSVCPPCSFCTHEGNLANLYENDDAWMLSGGIQEVLDNHNATIDAIVDNACEELDMLKIDIMAKQWLTSYGYDGYQELKNRLANGMLSLIDFSPRLKLDNVNFGVISF